MANDFLTAELRKKGKTFKIGGKTAQKNGSHRPTAL